MTALPTLKLRVLPTFPASVTGDGAITVTKAAGVYTIGLNQSISPTWTGAHTFNTTTGDAITITPSPSSTNKALSVTQTGPVTGSVAGPFSFNLFNITDSFTVTGTGTDSTGLSNGGAVGFRINTFFSGANVHAAGTLISGLYTATVTSTAAQGDITGLAGTAYTNVAASISGFLEGLNGFAKVGASGSGVNVLVGVDAGAMILTGGSANYRFGLNCASLGNVQGTTNDAAIAFLGAGGGAIAWKNGILLSNASGGAPISTTGSLIKSDTANTIANILDLGNITVSGNIAAFPFLGISGAGKAIFGAPIASLAAGVNLGVTATSSGNINLGVSTNTTSGFSSVSIQDSTANNVLFLATNEAARTGTIFGQTPGNWGQIASSGSANLGLLFGTGALVPVISGTNNTERMRLLLGLMVGTTTDPGAGSISANTSVVSPLIVGGTAAGSSLVLESTSGVGTTDAIFFKTGSQVGAGFVNTSQQWVFGSTAAAPAANAVLTASRNTGSPLAAVTATPIIHAAGVNSAQPAILLDSYAGANAGNQGFLVIRKARGTSAAATAVQSGDALGYLGMVGANANGAFASEVGAAGGIFFGAVTTQIWSASQAGCELRIYTTPNGSTTITQAVTVQQSGGLSVGSTTDGGIGTVLANVGFRVGANQVAGARITGYTAMTGSPDKSTAYATGTVTLAQLAGRVAQLQADLTTHGLIGA